MPRYYLAIFLIFIVLTGCGATLEQAYPRVYTGTFAACA